MRDDRDPIRKAIQEILDNSGDGWTVSDFCVPMGLERVHDGGFEQTIWVYDPPYQPDYTSEGLLEKALIWKRTADEFEETD